MKTVGQILKEAREAKFYTLEEIEKQTKIRRELLEALEEDDYSKLPPTTFIRGFIKNYGKFLGLSQEKLLAVFRRDFEASKHPEVVMESLARPVGRAKKLILTPSMLLGVMVFLIITSFFAYLWVEYRQFVGAPNLEVVSPLEGQTVETPEVLVEGETDPEARVRINEGEIGTSENGKFKEEIKLSSSSNKVVVTSTSKFGQTARIERTVFVKK